MADLSCRQADLLAADVETGRASAAEQMRLEVHLQRCESCAKRTERVHHIGSVLRSEPVEPRVADRALVASAMMEAHDAGPRRSRPAQAVPWLAAAAALLAVGSAAWWALTREPPAPVVEDRAAPEVAPEAMDPVEEQQEAVALTGLAHPCTGVTTETVDDARAFLLEARGTLCRLGVERGELRLDVDPEARADLVVSTPTANVKVVGTVFSVGVRDGFTSVVVYRGTVEVRRADESLRVTGGHRVGVGRDREALVEAADPEALAPLERLAEHAVVAPAEPSGEVVARRVPPNRVDEAARGAERPTEPEPAPQEDEDDTRVLEDLRGLLRAGRPSEARAQAQERLDREEVPSRRGEVYTVIAESYAMERNWRRAFEWYQRVQSVSRGTPTAANAMNAAADLALHHLRQPMQAAALYEAYLRQYPRGALHEDALIGRCRALMAAGRDRDAVACARAYLATHSEGRHRDRAQQIVRTATE